MFIDTHAHLTHPRFKAHERDEVLSTLGDSIIVNSSISFESNFAMLEKLSNYNNVYFSCGIHPNSVAFYNMDGFSETVSDHLQQLKNLITINSDKVLAVGECGLDTSRINASPNSEEAPVINPNIIFSNQVNLFKAQLSLARELSLPVVLHLRNCEPGTFIDDNAELPADVFDYALKMLDCEEYKIVKGIVHCFNSTLQCATNFVERGFYIGIGGTITRSPELQDVVKELSLKHIVLETDSPFLAPEGFSSAKNTPLSIPIIATEIAKIKNITVEEVLKVTTQNAIKALALRGE